MKEATRSLFLAVMASAMLFPVFASQHEPIGEREVIQIRALIVAESSAASSSQTNAASSSAAPTSAATTPTTTAAAAATSAAPATSHDQTSSSQQGATTTHADSPPQTSSTPPPVATSAVATSATNSAGQIVATTVIVSEPTMSSAAPSHTSSSDDSGGGGLSTGSIVGLSVSAGIAAIGIILFFVWKFTRKRFGDFDDHEAIKWPELNAHNTDTHALPTNATGRAGFGPENDSDINLTRAPSPGGAYANSIAASTVPEMYGAGDPYAVPPLPHLNPNQPYHDDPGTYGQPAGYYDPYRGPVPTTFGDPISDGHVTESIPMTQMARMRSPGPQAAYDMQGRGSPVPQAVVGYAGADERSRTPNPGALGAETGRASPSPHSGYGYGPR